MSYFQYSVFNIETYIVTHKRKAILATVVMVVRSRVKGQGGFQCLQIGRFKKALEVSRYFYFQTLPFVLVGKSTTRLRVTIDVGEIWFDIVDRRTIHQVSTQHVNSAVMHIHLMNTYRGKTEVVGTEGRARSPHADSLVTTQQGRTYCGMFLCTHMFRKFPDEPQIVISFQTT